MFGTLAAWNTGCTGGDDDDDDGHTPPDSITISGGTAVTVGTDLQLTATAVGGDDPGDITTISTWTTNSAGVATVGASTGLVTGVSAGTATITAEHDGVMGTTIVTVSTAAATFDATVTGDWSAAHGDGVPMFIRIVDDDTGDVVYCADDELTETVAATAGQLNAAAPGVLIAGHTYRAEAIADVGATVGTIDGTDHPYMSAAVGPIGADATLMVPHSGTAPGWSGTPCP